MRGERPHIKWSGAWGSKIPRLIFYSLPFGEGRGGAPKGQGGGPKVQGGVNSGYAVPTTFDTL